MKKAISRILSTPFGKRSIKDLLLMSGNLPFLPFYHGVSDHTPSYIKHLYPFFSKEAFKAQLILLQQYVSFVELDGLRHLPPTRTDTVAHVSFDDGLASVYSNALPILESLHIPATIFVNPDFAGNKDMLYRMKVSLLIDKFLQDKTAQWAFRSLAPSDCVDIPAWLLNLTIQDLPVIEQLGVALGISFKGYAKEHQPYMTWEQIDDARQRGFTIGAHSMSHPKFADIPKERQLKEVKNSLVVVQEHFPGQSAPFSFPFTDDQVCKEVFDWLGNQQVLSFGSAGFKEDEMITHYQRIPMEQYAALTDVELKAILVDFHGKRLVNRHKVRR